MEASSHMKKGARCVLGPTKYTGRQSAVPAAQLPGVCDLGCNCCSVVFNLQRAPTEGRGELCSILGWSKVRVPAAGRHQH